MNKNIQKVLDIWHTTFKDEAKQYSEFESSDVEYFVACMLYNYFNFEHALNTMKTIDLSYDFLLCVEENYDEVKALIESIKLENEQDKLSFLIEFLDDAKKKYTQDELYLINRLVYHVDGIKQRYNGVIQADNIDFKVPVSKSRNPLSGL